MYRFFETIDRCKLRMVFEPRGGAWTDKIVLRAVTDFNLTHGVDPFLRRPVGRGIRYYRLHGRPAYHYLYRYIDADLSALRDMPSPHFSPPFYCDGPMARPVWLSLGRSARHSVDYACALLGRESQPYRTLEPSRDERW